MFPIKKKKVVECDWNKSQFADFLKRTSRVAKASRLWKVLGMSGTPQCYSTPSKQHDEKATGPRLPAMSSSLFVDEHVQANKPLRKAGGQNIHETKVQSDPPLPPNPQLIPRDASTRSNGHNPDFLASCQFQHTETFAVATRTCTPVVQAALAGKFDLLLTSSTITLTRNSSKHTRVPNLAFSYRRW